MFAHKTALLSALSTALLASASLQAAEPLKAVGAGEGQLDIVAWPGYIERGDSDKAYDWVTGFEKTTTQNSSLPPLNHNEYIHINAQYASFIYIPVQN